MTDDERFEMFLRDAAADYQAPRGEVPRDDMWAAIQAQRGAVPRQPEAARPRLAPRPAVRQWAWMGMAATLVLGVLIGRYAMRTTPDSPVAVRSNPTAPGAGRELANASTPDRSPSAPPNTAAPAPAGPNVDRSGVRTPETRTAPSSASPYSVASARHLQAVQVLLATYSTEASDTRSDSLMALWARDLLSNTRLLLDSPAARDPQRARLLQDLEVILVQLVQRSPGGSTEERSAVERSIQKTQIIPRLRSALPASLQSGTE